MELKRGARDKQPVGECMGTKTHTERKHGQGVFLKIQKKQEWKNSSSHGYCFFAESRKRKNFLWTGYCLSCRFKAPPQTWTKSEDTLVSGCRSLTCLRQGLFVCYFTEVAS